MKPLSLILPLLLAPLLGDAASSRVLGAEAFRPPPSLPSYTNQTGNTVSGVVLASAINTDRDKAMDLIESGIKDIQIGIRAYRAGEYC